MIVAFRNYKHGDWLDRAVCFFSEKPYSHVELVFSDGMSYSAIYNKGLRFKRIDYAAKGPEFEMLEVPATPEQEARVRKFCKENEGRNYDVRGILSFITPIRHKSNEYFCSEIVAEALQRAGYLQNIKTRKVSPSALYKHLKKELVK
jgi:hypothetical protein